MNHIVEEYCARIAEEIDIEAFVIDREVNSSKTAQLFMSKGWELICLLDANEYRGVETFSKKFCKRLEDGTILYKAKWKEWREDDPRSFVLAQEPERLIVYWGTPKIVEKLTAEEFISVYRDRTEIQGKWDKENDSSRWIEC